MKHINLNRMLQGCSAFIQTMAGDRAARNDAKRVNNHVLPLTCLLLASSLRLTCPLQLRRIALIFAVLVMSTANIGMAWGDTFTDTHTVPTANTGLFSKIVTGDGASFGNSSLQTTSNGGTGSFTISTTDGSYISGITFTATADDRKPETFTSSDGTISNTGEVYTFTPSTATKTSCTFTMKGASGKTVRFAPVAVSLTSEYEYFSMNFSISSGTVSCTKSNGSSDVTITSTGSVSSNKLQVNNGKNLVLTSSAHNIQAIHFSFENHADKTYTASTGTYSSNTWTSNSNTQTVTFSSSASTNIVGFSVELVDLGVTHTVTAATDNASYGTAAAAKTTVAEGATTTITATPKSGYAFDHWTVSGTGATLSSTTTNPTTLTMGTADATVTAYFGEACDIQIYSLTDEIGSAVVTASDATVTAGTSLVMSNTSGRIKLTPASGKFKNGDKVEFGGTIGNTSKNYGLKIYASDGTTSAGDIYVAGTTSPLKASGTLSLASDQDYIFIARYDGTTTTLTSCEITRVSPCPEPPSCTAPSSVTVAPTNANGWRYSIGETISLTATATGGTGTKTYQWQKYIVDTWTDIDGATSATFTKTATSSDGGSYRCKVSTGSGCDTYSDGYQIYVFTLNGNYYGSVWTENAITWTGTYTGTVTLSLTESSTYMYKVTNNDSKWYGGTSGNFLVLPAARDHYTDQSADIRLFTGPAGDYTFTIDITHFNDYPGTPYVNISVAYPTVSHPASGYAYFKKWNDWSGYYIHWWYNDGSDHLLSTWGSDPQVTTETTICGTDYIYFPVLDTYNKLIVKDAVGDATHKTGDLSSVGSSGKYFDFTNDNAWNTFTTYTVTTSILPAGYGTVSAASVTGVACGTSISASTNTLTVGTTNVTAAAASATAEYTYAFDNWTWTPADATVTSDVTATANFTRTPKSYTLTWDLAGGKVTTAGTGAAVNATGTPSSSVAYGAEITVPTVVKDGYTFTGWDATPASTMPAANTTYTAQWTAAASQTALVANTLYEVPDMIPSGKSLTSSDQFFAGLSANTKFELIGSASGSTTPKVNNKSDNDKTIDGITFDDGSMWFKGNATLSSNIPTTFGLSFIIPEGGGKLYLYFSDSGTSTNIKLAKSGSEGSKPTLTDGYAAIDVTAGTYYLYGTGTDAPYCFYGLKLVVCTTPATAFGNGAYTVGGSALDLSTLISGKQGSGAITYTVKNANGTGASIDGTNFTATSAGTATVTATQAADATYCEKVMDATITVSAAGPSGDCITITNFATSNVNNTCGDGNGKIFYGYKGSVSDANALTITSNDGNDHGQNSGAEMRLTYNKLMRIYANNTTNAAPATFSNVTSVSFKWKFIASGNSGNTELTSSYTVKVGSTTIANAVSITGKTKDGYQTVTIDNLAQLSGYVEIKFSGSSSSYNVYIDDIEICTSSLPSCTTPTLPTLSNQAVCEGADIAAWDATVTNASAISAAGETVTYSWKKKGNATELANTASFDLGSSATEAMAGTYVVTATVSADDKASSTATKEVTLTVNEATEVTAITADKATVYPGNSVTLTATANMDATWQWYTCTNAEGDGEEIIDEATSASYTIASAPAAGTHYYKVQATGSCGIAERVYTLTVTAASECEIYYWFIYADDATANGVINNRDGFFSNTTTGTGNTGTYTMTVDGTSMTGTKRLSTGAYKPKFTVPAGAIATLYIYGKAASSDAGKHLVLKRTSDDAEVEVTSNTTVQAYTKEDIEPGEWTLSCGSSNWCYSFFAVKVCSASSCTDATPTITAANTTVCVGGELSIAATGYETGATFQWQKLNGSAWDNISGAESATYTVTTAAAEHAGSYRLVATKGCARTSNTVTISVPSAPNFGSTVPASVSVMQTIALSINTVEATDATKYKWYKSADATWDAGDTEIGTNKELIKAYDSEAIGSPSYYIFCRAQNACGITTSTAIAVNVTAYVEEDCATRGNESDAEFGFQNSGAGQGDYGGAKCWTMSKNSKILVYSAPDGKYFKTMKVTIASSSASKASYNWSTDGGSSYTDDGVAITGVTTTLTEKTIDLSAHGNVNEVKIGRNFGNGESSGTLYVSKICFEYTAACTATTVTPSESSVNYEMDGSSFTEPTFTVKYGGTAFDPQPTLTYSSSNEDIASVDDDGTVTFNGNAGTVTITAAYAGNATYCASEGSYTITVSCPGGAPKVVASGSVDMSGCNSSVTLLAKTQADGDFADGTYQWFRNGTEIDGATSSSYTATQAGTYTVAYTSAGGCTSPSTNNATITSETTEPEVERLVPFQYYHVDKTYSDQMKMRHLFAVKNSGTLDGKHFKMYVSRNGGAATDVTSSNALVVVPNGDGHVDTVKVDLNKLKSKYSENDELVYTCKAIDCESNVSEVYKNTITMRVIGATPTLALICSGSNKASGTRKTGELTVGGDFLTGYNVADLCVQTGNESFDKTQEWGLYTDLKTQYIVTPVNGYAVFNKLNYEPFDILLLTDYPKASKSDAAKDVLDDMAALCDYRPMLSFKTHMVAKSPSKWAEKGFTTSPVVTKADGKLNLNIVCYAHPMFASLTEGADVYKDNGDLSQLVYTMLSEPGYESSKGMQGFEIAAAENFVTIGLTHYNGTIAKNSPSTGKVTWTPGSEDRMLVTVAERQTNIEARFILFSINCGAQSKLTAKGEEVILACLEYLLDDDPLHVADCALTFDNGAGNTTYDAGTYAGSGVKGDGKWSTEANWGPNYLNIPGEFNSARIAAPVTVDMEHAKAMELRIVNEGSINIPAGKGLEVTSTIRRMDGSEIYPTDVNDIHIGSASTGNGTLIFNNNAGDTKAHVDMYSTAQADVENMSAANSTWQYIGTPHTDVTNARSNYYGSWLYQYSGSGWEVIPNGGPLVPFRGYCVTHPDAPVVFSMEGTLAATTSQDIAIPAGYTVIANSWVAPIDINAITNDDMEGISDKSIYFFNTGSDSERTGAVTENATDDARWAAGTYVTIPIHSAPYTGADDHIPSMQGFYVWSTTAGTLHLDYDRHVRGQGRGTIVSGRMHAPKRVQAEDNAPEVLWLVARGNHYDDRLVVLEREDYTRRYDSGWDGEAWGGSDLSPMVYITNEAGVDEAVSAIPEFEGTVITFRAGEDSEYRFEFVYSEDAEPLYLFDTENNTYTQIMTGNAYYFTTSDKAPHSRFILTRKAPQIATGTELTSDGEGANAKKLLIEDKMYILLNGMLYDATGKVVK